MTDKKPPTSLRSAAEAAFAHAAPGALPGLPAADQTHELRVHQIELEMQNEALRQSQVALESARDRYVDLYDFAPVGYLTLAASGQIAEANLTAGTLLGVDRKALRQTRFDQWIRAADRARWQRLFIAAKADDTKLDCDLALVPRDGLPSDFRVDCQRSTDDEGQASVRVTLTDISERTRHADAEVFYAHRVEALLLLPQAADRLGETAFMQIGQELAEELTGSSVAFIHFVNDDEQTIELVTWSRRTLESYCQAAFDKHYPVQQAGLWADALRQRAPVVFNDYSSTPHRHGLPEGHATLTRLISVPVLEGGKVRMLTGVGNKADAYTDRDVETVQLLSNEIWRIVSQRRAVDALRESETRYRTAFAGSPDSMSIMDLADGMYVDVNDAFSRLLGWTREEVIGRTVKDLDIWYDRSHWPLFIQEVEATGRCDHFEARFRAKDGRIVDALVTASRMPLGERQCILAATRDVTDRKRTEEELNQYREHLEQLVGERTRELEDARQTADAANRAKSTFLANMSHEIRTPMNGILGMAYLVRRSGVTPKQADQLDKVAAAGQHLLGIINDVLDLAKIEAGKFVLEDKDFTLAELAHGVTSVIEENVRAKGLTLHVDLAGMPALLRGDRTRLQQALLNYLGNAVKFTEAGHVTLRGRLLEETASEYTVRFDVIDTGIGIPARATGQLFTAFHQADAGTTRQFGGTGLGLVITKHVAALMGGEVGVESTLGKGSMFWLTVRLGKGQAVALATTGIPDDSPEARLRRDHSGARVLLVEDDLLNQEVAAELLGQVGLKPELANDGRDAVRMAAQDDYALILMDVQMPGMGGLEATQSIRALPGRAKTPIIAMTAGVFDDDRRACQEAGMDGFIAKPLEPEHVFATILKWLDREKRGNA